MLATKLFLTLGKGRSANLFWLNLYFFGRALRDANEMFRANRSYDGKM